MRFGNSTFGLFHASNRVNYNIKKGYQESCITHVQSLAEGFKLLAVGIPPTSP